MSYQISIPPIQILFLLAAVALLVLFGAGILKREGVFLSPNSLVLRAHLSLLFRHPERYTESIVEEYLPSKRLRNLTNNLIRLILFVGATLLISLILWNYFPGFWNPRIASILQLTPQMWQVHATIAGFSFVVLVFFWETLTQNVSVHDTIGRLTENTEALGTIYTLLFSNVAIGASAWHMNVWLPDSPTASEPPVGLLEVVAASVALGVFILTLVALIEYYENLYRTLFQTGIEQAVLEGFTDELNDLVSDRTGLPYEKYISRIQSVTVPEYLFSYEYDAEQITAEELSLGDTMISDIHLGRLQKAVSQLDQTGGSIEIRVRPGQRLQAQTRLAQIESVSDETQIKQFKEILRTSVRVKS